MSAGVHAAQICALYERQGLSPEQIGASLQVPKEYVEVTLLEKCPQYRADLELSSNSAKAIEDIPDEMFERVKQELFQMGLDRNIHAAVRSRVLTYIWDRKRPLATGQEGSNITQINIAIANAQEVRRKKLGIPEPVLFEEPEQ